MSLYKKAVSQVVTYVLLIITALSLSVLVFTFLQGFIPEEKFQCPNELSIIIRDFECGSGDPPLDSGKLLIDVVNKGNFEIDGMYARYSSSEAGAASKPLTPLGSTEYGSINRITEEQASQGFFYFGRSGDVPSPLRPGKNYTQLFGFLGTAKKIELQPFVNLEDKRELGICEERVITRIVNCN